MEKHIIDAAAETAKMSSLILRLVSVSNKQVSVVNWPDSCDRCFVE